MSRPSNILPLPGDWLFIAGATGLVGRAVAEAAAAAGVNLVVHSGRDAAAAAELADRLAPAHGVTVLPVTVDITDPVALEAALGRLSAAGLDRIDALVNLVTGYQGRPRPVADLTPEEFRHVVEVDLVGPYVLARACLPLLSRAAAARVVLVSSLAGLRGRPAAAHLCAAKAGVGGLALALSMEFVPLSIAVNTLAPGPIARPGVPHFPTPVPLSTPESVAEVVLRLASPQWEQTGRTLVVAGGPPITAPLLDLSPSGPSEVSP